MKVTAALLLTSTTLFCFFWMHMIKVGDEANKLKEKEIVEIHKQSKLMQESINLMKNIKVVYTEGGEQK